MRPINRGNHPTDVNGNDIVFSTYQSARDPLINRIGDFCSYCEVCLHSSISVEHVQPKSIREDLRLSWDNFLLACPNCNSTKTDTDINLDDYLWPDRDNTAKAFQYELDQTPQVSRTLNATQKERAQNLVNLCGLDRYPGHEKYSDKDRRWLKRREAWGIALISLRNLQRNDTPEQRESIILTAISRGFWSVWMTVFSADLDMRKRLIASFSGTERNCFDENSTEFNPRPGGQV